MYNNMTTRTIILIFVAITTFSVFFADGYLQWINSDTAVEAYALSQSISFPQALSPAIDSFHSRITGHILSFISFNIVGPIYREITGDPVNSLYISQGFMTGTVYTCLVMISALFVSGFSSVLSARYVFSSVVLMLFTMALPATLSLNQPFGITLRFGHQAVMTNYIGTMVIALVVLIPYGRYLFTGKWNDWYDNTYLRVFYCCFLFAAAFSSTATTVWLGIMSAFLIVSLLWAAKRNKGMGITDRALINEIYSDTKYHPLISLGVLCTIAVFAESFTVRSANPSPPFDMAEYVKTYLMFFVSIDALIILIAIVLCSAAIFYYCDKYRTSELHALRISILFLLPSSLVFIFLIGTTETYYRFHGYNLGRDTSFPAIWIMTLWVFSVFINIIKEKVLIWIAPILLFTLFTNALNFFSFPYYVNRFDQKRVFDGIRQFDIDQPSDVVLGLSWRRLAFSKEACETATLPMLRKAGIISQQREVVVSN